MFVAVSGALNIPQIIQTASVIRPKSLNMATMAF